MCGIIGIAGTKNISHNILESLKILEYRGYDSAGLTILDQQDNLQSCKAVGKVQDLVNKFSETKIEGSTGIGHTRWATHGMPALENTHPFVMDNLALVHNGIIENYNEIKKKLADQGHKFYSQTDTEVILALIKHYITSGNDIVQAVLLTVKQLKGNYAFVLLASEKKLICVKNGSPLVLGIAEKYNCTASDAIALSPFTDLIIHLNDQEIAILKHNSYKIFNFNGEEIKKSPKKVSITYSTQKGEFDHYMLKEIYEQPQVLKNILTKYKYADINKKFLKNIDWKKVTGISIVACGTSYHTALISKYLFESNSRLPIEVELASEFRSRDIIFDHSKFYLFISQSGETIDTLVALKLAKDNNVRCVVLVNVLESSIAQTADYVLPICAGTEIAVASTKAFTAQLFILSILSHYIALEKALPHLTPYNTFLDNINSSIDKIKNIFAYINDIKRISQKICYAKKIIYIGRNISYPLSLEGALKLKELTYIPALGVAAGELKHGSIALIDQDTYNIVLAPDDKTFTKIISNIQEIHARKGKIILLTNAKIDSNIKNLCDELLEIPSFHHLIQPISYSIILQLIAYYTATFKGCNVDKPRNLAKSVTVE